MKELEYVKADALILAERDRQDQKWGEQNHSMEWWLAILMEEVGELSQAVLEKHFGGRHGTHEQVKCEAVQVAAVAHAILECIERRTGTMDAIAGPVPQQMTVEMDFDRGEQYFRVCGPTGKTLHSCNTRTEAERWIKTNGVTP